MLYSPENVETEFQQIKNITAKSSNACINGPSNVTVSPFNKYLGHVPISDIML